jgi:microcystin-dependent protein
MISSEVQRTLVKSPPELWTELSDPDSLARHLGELGEIRITCAEPEKRVDWEADGTSGSVLIKASGWGTKVTLSVTREILPAETHTESGSAEADAELQATDADTQAEASESTDADTESEQPVLEISQAAIDTAEGLVASELEPVDSAQDTIEVSGDDLPTTAEANPPVEVGVEAEPAPRRGFFARLFGRRKPEPLVDEAPQPIVELSVDESPTPAIAEPVPSAIDALQARFQAEAMPDESTPAPNEVLPANDKSALEAPVSEPERAAEEAPPAAEQEPTADLAAELQAAEEVAVEEVTAVLTAVLDRLGAAHHRPFSRA